MQAKEEKSEVHLNRVLGQLKTKQEVKFSGHEKVWGYLYFCFIMIFIFYLSADAPFSNVFVAFFPSILIIILSYLLLSMIGKEKKVGILVVPIAICILFFALTSRVTGMFEKMDIESITIFNFFLGMIFVFVLLLMNQIEKTVKEEVNVLQEEHKKKQTVSQVALQHQPRMLQQYIRSIEDKSKAINFVIGRVYSNKRGGSPELRDKIKVPSEWYNEFSSLEAENEDKTVKTAWTLLSKIQERLMLLQRTEQELFANQHFNLKRDPEGKSRIIDVLIWNDKDPVENYYREALNFLHQIYHEHHPQSFQKKPMEPFYETLVKQ